MRLSSRNFVAAVLVGAWIFGSGCAQLKHQPVANFNSPSGIPYYLGSWYLLVHTDGKGALKSKLLFLMDPRLKMEARPRAWFASMDSLLKLDGGVLTSTETKIDTTAVPVAILKAAEKAASMMVANDVAVNARVKSSNGIPAPSIFRVQVDPPATAGDATIVTFVGELSDFSVEVY